MQTHIYACYLPGDTIPAYVGSHTVTPSERSAAHAWRYAHCRYVGAGTWIYPDGKARIPAICRKHSKWAQKLAEMSPEALAAIRIEILATVDAGERWARERAYIQHFRPAFNLTGKRSDGERRQAYNAYHRSYSKGYYAANPDKAEAKRAKDRERMRAIRAKAKADVA